MKIVFVYDPDKNHENAFIDGVPLADIDDVTWVSLPDHVQAGVLNCPFYTHVTAVRVVSQTLDIPGIGAEIIAALENAGFATVADVASATDEQLLNVSGIGPARLVNIRAALALEMN